MGIKLLNRFLLDNCTKKAIYKTNFKEFQNKTIVIDASIYIYKFVSDGLLIENLFVMVSILLHYKIVPIFIFDGKPPAEKMELLEQRKLKKIQAKEQYNVLKIQCENSDIDQEDLQEIKDKMDVLKKQFVRISMKHIQTAKTLLQSYGITYYEANGEADRLCASMVISGKAWACISDDMDMLVYGCTRVIRQISLLNRTCVFYDMNTILYDLQMDQDLFRQIVVLSGTDYNIHVKTSLHETIKWFYEYQKENTADNSVSHKKNYETPFYDWLCVNTKYIENKEMLINTYHMFCIENDPSTDDVQCVNKTVGTYDKNALYKLLRDEGFLCLDELHD